MALPPGSIKMVCNDPGSNQQKESKKLESETRSHWVQDSVITQQRLAIAS
jgi:hypothetical protein